MNSGYFNSSYWPSYFNWLYWFNLPVSLSPLKLLSGYWQAYFWENNFWVVDFWPDARAVLVVEEGLKVRTSYFYPNRYLDSLPKSKRDSVISHAIHQRAETVRRWLKGH